VTCVSIIGTTSPGHGTHVLELHWCRGGGGGREWLSKCFCKNEVETEKIVGYVTRGVESEDGVGVGVAVEVGRSRVKATVKNVEGEKS